MKKNMKLFIFFVLVVLMLFAVSACAKPFDPNLPSGTPSGSTSGSSPSGSSPSGSAPSGSNPSENNPGESVGDLYVREGYIYFGEYPQTIKADSVTITATQDTRGYYLGSDGKYYAKIVANPYGSNYKFSNNTTVVDGTTYYFKVEPIKWRILKEDNGVAFLLCDSIIANHRFDDSSNNYKESEIRAWLNETFYSTAFTDLQQAIIKTTLVDNSASSTGESENQYACENTNDKVFLLSYSEVTSSAYGFTSDVDRIKQTSDYVRANYGYMVTDGSYYGNGWWWLRLPNVPYSYIARGVSHDGSVYGDNVSSTRYGVVPALWIELS